MKIELLSVSTADATARNGKTYQVAEVAFKNLDSGKVEGKKITSYSTCFEQIAKAATGQVYEIKTEKDEKGYWQWLEITPSTKDANTPQQTPMTSKPSNSTPVKSNFETPEERAARQVYIVKQSSLANAITTLTVGAKSLDAGKVLELAQQYTDWVFAKPEEKQVPIIDMEDDIPF